MPELHRRGRKPMSFVFSVLDHWNDPHVDAAACVWLSVFLLWYANRMEYDAPIILIMLFILLSFVFSVLAGYFLIPPSSI
jgi:hypothetical protein